MAAMTGPADRAGSCQPCYSSGPLASPPFSMVHTLLSQALGCFWPASCLENPTPYAPTLFKYRANHELWASISKVPRQQAPAKDANQDLSTSLTSSQLYVPFTGCGR